MKAHDRDALERALAEARQEGPDRAEQLDSIAADDWLQAAKLAATICQYKSLSLSPCDSVPMDGDIEPEKFPEAADLLARMLAAGVSRYEPDPVRALQTKNKEEST